MGRILLSLLLSSLLFALPLGIRAAAATGINRTAAARLYRQGNRAEVAEIETYARGLDRFIKQNARAARYFADTSSPEQENARARWQEFKTKRALDKAWQDGATYTSSNVWFNPSGELAVAIFTFSSPSGDWAQYMTNYYRKDGTLAKTSAELRTFMGDIIRINDRLYDTSGKLVREQTRYLDLTTRKPKKVRKDGFMDIEPPLYMKTSALPFYNLLKRR
jgi:hypothetical protein